jgi:hypothetical protein
MKKLMIVFLMTFMFGVAGNVFAIYMVDGLGGSSGYGENQLADNDDNSTGFLDLSSVMSDGMDFFGNNYSGLYLNNNGNVTFESAMSTYTPFNLTGNTGNPIIAPFFADVDTRGAGDLFYDFDTTNGIFTATWDQVGYYASNTDLLNSFQLRLIDQGSGNFDIEFLYEFINWTIGDASGTAHARAGYNSGNGTDYYELAESGIPADILDLENRSNVGVDGLFQWNVRNGLVEPPPTVNPVPEPSTILLLGSGLLGLGWYGRKRKKA